MNWQKVDALLAAALNETDNPTQKFTVFITFMSGSSEYIVTGNFSRQTIEELSEQSCVKRIVLSKTMRLYHTEWQQNEPGVDY